MGRVVEFRSWVFPAAQAVLTGSSTAVGVLLVVLWRPGRKRWLPFYSDATHNDPERIVLAWGENCACFFMPLVALVEFMHQSRLSANAPTRPAVPRPLRYFVPARATTYHIVIVNFLFTAVTTLFFFTTANVPSKHPYTSPHQLAASALIFVYAVQATLKAILAETFNNYETSLPSLELASDTNSAKMMSGNGGVTFGKSFQWRQFWARHHMKMRLGLAFALWMSLLLTWLCYVGRVTTRTWGVAFAGFRAALAMCMAGVVHVATVSCVTLMGVMVIDMQNERVVLTSRCDDATM